MEINKIYNTDCIEGMQLMEKENLTVDCILTSPPYNTARTSGQMENIRYDVFKEIQDNEGYCNWSVDVFNCFDKVLKTNGKVLYNLSYGNENPDCMYLVLSDIIRRTNFMVADVIVWEKYNAFPNNENINKLTRICEFVYVLCRKSEYYTFTANKRLSSYRKTGQKVYESIVNKIRAKNNDEQCPYNKATFSVDLCTKLMNIYCKEKDLILDPFMGTGTTAVAAHKLQMNYLGFELSEKQCEWANERINRSKSQISIFDIL